MASIIRVCKIIYAMMLPALENGVEALLNKLYSSKLDSFHSAVCVCAQTMH